MNDEIAEHCEELNRCNQRGGRMLSIFDLLTAGTLNLELAAYLMARISKGSSFMAGSVPGGAGKTTVMCALLNLVPIDVPLIAATPQAVRRATEGKESQRSCYVCHEIGSGDYFAYLWGDALQEYCRLFERGHMLATNLHADDLEEARDQVCSNNGVPPDHFNKFELLIFLRVDGGYLDTHRWIEKVYSSDGESGHGLVFHASNGKELYQDEKHYLANLEYVGACRDFLKTTAPNTHTIERTRKRIVEFLDLIK